MLLLLILFIKDTGKESLRESAESTAKTKKRKSEKRALWEANKIIWVSWKKEKNIFW